jgi:hypothetical protein
MYRWSADYNHQFGNFFSLGRGETIPFTSSVLSFFVSIARDFESGEFLVSIKDQIDPDMNNSTVIPVRSIGVSLICQFIKRSNLPRPIGMNCYQEFVWMNWWFHEFLKLFQSSWICAIQIYSRSSRVRFFPTFLWTFSFVQCFSFVCNLYSFDSAHFTASVQFTVDSVRVCHEWFRARWRECDTETLMSIPEMIGARSEWTSFPSLLRLASRWNL